MLRTARARRAGRQLHHLEPKRPRDAENLVHVGSGPSPADVSRTRCSTQWASTRCNGRGDRAQVAQSAVMCLTNEASHQRTSSCVWPSAGRFLQGRVAECSRSSPSSELARAARQLGDAVGVLRLGLVRADGGDGVVLLAGAREVVGPQLLGVRREVARQLGVRVSAPSTTTFERRVVGARNRAAAAAARRRAPRPRTAPGATARRRPTRRRPTRRRLRGRTSRQRRGRTGRRRRARLSRWRRGRPRRIVRHVRLVRRRPGRPASMGGGHLASIRGARGARGARFRAAPAAAGAAPTELERDGVGLYELPAAMAAAAERLGGGGGDGGGGDGDGGTLVAPSGRRARRCCSTDRSGEESRAIGGKCGKVRRAESLWPDRPGSEES